MDKRTCSVDGCDKPHRARGLCRIHYKREHERHEVECVTCGASFKSCRATGKFCSDQCKGDQYRTRTVVPLPRTHPVRVLMREVREPKPIVTRSVDCEWCGAAFTTTRSDRRMCSVDCKIKAKRCRRRGRQAGSASHYTWAEVMRLFLRFDRCCAYCEQPVIGQPDPDHVVPLSRGGSNSITNILPCCRLCNSDKRDLLLDEWAADRERRGLPPRVTSWASDDLRARHLTSVLTAA